MSAPCSSLGVADGISSPQWLLTVAPVDPETAQLLLDLTQLPAIHVAILQDFGNLAEEALQDREPSRMTREQLPLHDVAISRGDLEVATLALGYVCVRVPVLHVTPPR